VTLENNKTKRLKKLRIYKLKYDLTLSNLLY
jgi:hypothetical protein